MSARRERMADEDRVRSLDVQLTESLVNDRERSDRRVIMETEALLQNELPGGIADERVADSPNRHARRMLLGLPQFGMTRNQPSTGLPARVAAAPRRCGAPRRWSRFVRRSCRRGCARSVEIGARN